MGRCPPLSGRAQRPQAAPDRGNPSKGGAVTDIAADGIRARWATITGWEPGRRLALSWARDDGTGSTTEVFVTLTPVRTGTRVDLATGAPAVWQAALPAYAARACALLAA